MLLDPFIYPVVDFLKHGGWQVILDIVTPLACNSTLVPSTVRWSVEALGACDIQTEVAIPSIYFTPAMGAVLSPTWTQMPNTTIMTECRLGELVGRLEAVKTPQGRQALEAVKRYTDQSKKAIKSIDKSNLAAKRIANNSKYNLEGLINALNRASSRPKSSSAINQIMSFQQHQIDNYFEGFQKDLRELYQHAVAVQENLEACDSINTQIFTTAGVALADMQDYLDDRLSRDASLSMMTTIFVGPDEQEVRAPLLRAIEDFGTLGKANLRAQKVVANLLSNLEVVMDGIQAASRSADGVRVINMGMDEQVEMTIEMLKKLEQRVEKGKIEER